MFDFESSNAIFALLDYLENEYIEEEVLFNELIKGTYMPSKKAFKKKDSLYTFNQYLDNKDNLGTKSLEAHPWSKKFLSEIFQKSWRGTYSNENLDKFICNLELDKLEKLLQPARIILLPNVANIVCHWHRTINLDVLAKILATLTSNIDILNDLYTLYIPFSTISGKVARIGSDTSDILKNIFEVCKKKIENWSGNTYEEICKRRADVLNFLKKCKTKSYDINSANDDVDNNITNQTTIEQNSFNLYITNTNKLEGYSWSTIFFLSQIFQHSKKLPYSNKDFDAFIDNLELDKLEKLLQPARIIEPSNITCMLSDANYMISLNVLADILKVLILNIDILKTLYDSDIPFSAISGKLSRMGSYAEDCMWRIFTILKKNRESQKNSKDFVSCFKTLEQKLDIVKNDKHKTRVKVINSMLKEYINIQETNNDNDEKIDETVHELTNNLTINNNQSQIIDKHSIDKHREDDIENSSNEINTRSDSQELTSNISNSALTTNEILNRALAIDDNDIKEIELKLNNYTTNQVENQSQLSQIINKHREDDIENSSNEINTSNLDLDTILCLALDMEDTLINKVVTEAANISTVNNQSQPIKGYQENNIENLQIIRQTHTEKVMQSAEKRKSCYDEYKGHSYARKRQCNNLELNSNHSTEVALNEPADSINVDCHTFGTISHLAGESICILSSDTEGFIITGTAGYSASILE
ncbi:hypothetical protein OTSUT76_1016 [Orientia tsutsugamushi str. UT76]|uniref:Repeat-containing protein D n=1 Tax=Orientia tsutsugamushi TaxID=784 RepID=A0A2U3RA87_ORITS|nr:hypothetical protein [Orientia tsutsugamushi]KJV90918.1 hypothetical protein OTSUT76_1016 [Orientia tsutsugamushi str. UT76]SPR10132.1 repeat-containing protein D [Orientia tsutsugamushi]